MSCPPSPPLLTLQWKWRVEKKNPRQERKVMVLKNTCKIIDRFSWRPGEMKNRLKTFLTSIHTLLNTSSATNICFKLHCESRPILPENISLLHFVLECNTNRNHLLPKVLSGQSAALHQMDAPVVDSSDWVSTFSSLSDLASRLGGSALVTQLWQMMHPTGMTGTSEAQAALAGFSQGRKPWLSANRMWKSGELLMCFLHE